MQLYICTVPDEQNCCCDTHDFDVAVAAHVVNTNAVITSLAFGLTALEQSCQVMTGKRKNVTGIPKRLLLVNACIQIPSAPFGHGCTTPGSVPWLCRKGSY